jgi:hypothetical protein
MKASVVSDLGRRSVLFLSLLTAFASTLPAQTTWRRSWGGLGSDEGVDVRQLSDEGYLVFGTTGGFGQGSSDLYAIRTDAEGLPIWTMVYGGPGTDFGAGCREMEEGFALAGTTSTGQGGGYDMFLVRTDGNGEELWQRSYGGPDWDICRAFTSTMNGYALAGIGYTETAPQGSGRLLMTDVEGEVVWDFTVGTADHSEFLCVTSDNDGGVIAAGTIRNSSGDENALIVRLSASGEELWRVSYGGDSTERVHGIVHRDDGTIVTCGTTVSDEVAQQIQLLAFSSTGELLWERRIGNTADAGGAGIVERPDGGLAFTGYNTLNQGERDMIFTVTDQDGWFQYGTNFGNGLTADGRAISTTVDGGFVVAGWCEGCGVGPRSVYAVKTNSLGETASLDVISFEDDVSVQEIAISTIESLWPNPVVSGEDFHFSSRASTATSVRIMDDLGRLVRTQPAEVVSGTISSRDLPPGAYTLVVQYPQNKREFARFIVR